MTATRYRHTQPGKGLRWILGATAVALGVVTLRAALVSPRAAIAPAVTLAVTVAAARLFHSLTVEVSDERIAIAFGPGWLRKELPVSELREARRVRSSWWHGLGIRYLAPGWLYAISGLDAVEVRLASGRLYRIGTDEPRALLAAIEAVLPDCSEGPTSGGSRTA